MKMPFVFRCAAVVAGGAACLLSGPGVCAEAGYPSKPIRLIVPYAVGGNADIVARILAPKLSEALGEQLIVDNRPGASGNIGAELAARAPADGYTLVIATNTHAGNMTLYRQRRFDLIRDFAPISLLGSTPLVLVVTPTLPAKTVRELVALAKAGPDKLDYASGGSGSSNHLAMELFKSIAGIDMVHVTYKGAGAGMIDMISGQIDTMMPSVTSARPHIEAGRLRGIAVTSLGRSQAVPEIPTIAESGYPGFEAVLWNALVAPAGTPQPILRRLGSEIVRVLQLPEVATVLDRQGFQRKTSTPEELSGFMKAEIAKWAKVVRASGAHVD